MTEVCAVDYCEREPRARGWCQMHYIRWKKHGDPTFTVIGNKSCTVAGCDEKYYGKGFCGPHYRQATRDAKREYDAARREDPTVAAKKRQQDRAYYQANKERHAELGRAYRAKNADKIAAWWRDYYKANADQRRAASRAYARENPDRVRATKLAHYRANREGYIARAAKRRAIQVKMSLVPFRTEDWLQRVAYYGGLCWMCRSAPYEEMDHVKPLSKGGAHVLANLRPACFDCNRSKAAKWPLNTGEAKAAND